MLALFMWTVVAVSLRAQTPTTLFRLLSTSETGITFRNDITENEMYNGISFTNAYNGSGVAAGDVNGDGLPDLFFSGTQVCNRLYINKGNFQFEDVTYRAGVADSGSVGRGVVMVDIDGDGDLDIYVCRVSLPNRLYINDGHGMFTERSKAYGLDYSGHSTQAAFLDYDLDGDLDMYLALTGAGLGEYYARYGVNDKMYRNNGNGTFTDVTKEAGIVDQGYAMNVLASDVNGDGWPDLYVSNDFEEQDKLYINNRNGTFTNMRGKAILHTSHSSMGCDAADYNNDGNIDVVTLDMMARDHTREMRLSATLSVLSPIFDSSQVPRNVLLLNRGNGLFTDIAGVVGIDATDWSWPALFADFDNDGRKDLFIGNGMKRDMTDRDASYKVVQGTKKMDLIRMFPVNRLANFCFWNAGDMMFRDSATAWGLDQPNFTYGAAYVDLDLDGDLDLVLNTVDTTAFLYRNYSGEKGRGNYLRVKLEGTGANRYGQNARVEFKTGDQMQLLEQMPVRGYLGCVDPVLHVGLGAARAVDTVTVRWPGGTQQTLTNVQANQTITLRQSEAARTTGAQAAAVKPLFTKPDSGTVINYSHEENSYDDLKRERLLPRRLSQNGPGMAVGDVNGDGLEDLYISGAKEFPGRLFMQRPDGRFARSADSAVFVKDSASEDMGALFFDADNDGDLDLYVVSGGAEFDARAPELADRLYLNDGKGRFTKTTGKLPEETASGSCVVAADYDGDGDLDLFVGGRMVPGKYPLASRSMILRNNQGTFTDVTAEVCPSLAAQPGMICAAIWSDVDADGRLDLVTAGEWTSVRMFHNDGSAFTEMPNTGLENITGWWNSIASGDFDNDGDIDYIVGNVGTNWRYQPSADAPVKIYAADFDGNGSLDPVLTYFDRTYKKEFPVMDRLRLISHIPSIHAKFTTFAAYSTATINDMFPKAKLDSSYKLTATEFKSCYIENRGNGTFTATPLPLLTQASPVFGIAVQDFDGDGNLDAMLTGNYLDGPEPTVVRYDGSWGLVLKGDGHGGFKPLTLAEGGIIVRGDMRGVALVHIGKATSQKLCAMVLMNSGPVTPFFRDVSAAGDKLWTLDRKTRATHAMIALKNGSTRRCEFNMGSGYLTQNTPTIIVTPDMVSMTLFNGSQTVQQVKF